MVDRYPSLDRALLTRDISAFQRRARRTAAGAICAAAAALAASCGARGPTAPAPFPRVGTVPIMGAARLNGRQLAAWVNGRQPRPSGSYAATVPLETLAGYFIDEGADEGVRGDLAFVQSIIETGWFRFNGSIPASANNFAGIGATDASPAPARFRNARIGVRAQIQHLRAYADASARMCSAPPLRHACVDPRFHLVVPKGKAPTWNQLGNGNWASAPAYAAGILQLYTEALAFNGVR